MNYNKNYLSKRPFLVVTTRFLPGQGAKTQTQGWAEQYGWNVAEEIAIVDRVTPKHQTYATLIIDVLEAKCVKNGFHNSSADEAMAHYMDKYKAQIKDAMGVWLEREAQRVAAGGAINLEAARKDVRKALGASQTPTQQVEAATVTPVADLPASE